MTSRTDMASRLAAVPGAIVKMGCSLMGAGQGDKALALVRKLLAERPGDPEVEAAARTILSHRVPQWHGPMIADEARNRAFERAIVRAVRPGSTVLDIGTGSGLLAMIAARAGAARVVACEAHRAIAGTAEEIVAKNGYGDVVRVIPRSSHDLARGEDLGGGADVVVAEVFGNDLLNESALATLEHAVRELARPGARIIPSTAAVRVALAWFDGEPQSVGAVIGFDLSPFERHIYPSRTFGRGDKRLHMRSDPQDLFTFQFDGPPLQRTGRAELAMSVRGGEANGLVQWIRLELDEETTYENIPAHGAASHWAVLFHPFPAERRATEGESVAVSAVHDGERLAVWFPEA